MNPQFNGMRPQIILLRDGTDTSQGKGQLISNINACQAVVEAVRTTLGPRGMDKLVVSESGKVRYGHFLCLAGVFFSSPFSLACVRGELAALHDRPSPVLRHRCALNRLKSRVRVSGRAPVHCAAAHAPARRRV